MSEKSEHGGHGGHRERLIEKLSQNAVLSPHEYLEIALFNVLPRIDTRPIAHRREENVVHVSKLGE